MRCPSCDAPLATIAIELGDSMLTMGSCNECRQRHWYRDGARFDLRAELVGVRSR